MFKLYDCKVRLGGSVLNEVPKTGITAPEIEVYRAIHGSDAVVDVKLAGQVKRSDRDERARIEDLFAPAGALGDVVAKKKRMIADLFGHASNPLPKELVEQAVEEDLEDDADVVLTETPQRVDVKEKAPAFTE